MAWRDEYTIAWICKLPIEVAAAKATLDRIHDELPPDCYSDEKNNYILGSLQDHNVVVAYPNPQACGERSLADMVAQLHASYTCIRFDLIVGVAGGLPSENDDIRLGDVVVGNSTVGRPLVVQHHAHSQPQLDRSLDNRTSDQPTPLLLAAIGKAETAAIFDESKMTRYLTAIVQKDSVTFAHPGPEHDILYEPGYDHASDGSGEGQCTRYDPGRIRRRQPRAVRTPIVHYGRIASKHDLKRDKPTQGEVACRTSILCIDEEATELRDTARTLVIRGICDYADSHRSKLWHAYAAAAAASYAKEILSFVPTISKTVPLATPSYVEAAPILDALLLTRPEVDRKSLIALKGRRVAGTCDWLIQHAQYQEWLTDASRPLLWISGGPGKGKTMLAIYITEALQPVAEATKDVLLYYFCSNRDKNRNTALTIMRGILHQWVDLHPHLAKHVKNVFDGTETTRYTISSFVSLWRVFLSLLQQSTAPRVICILDGLDECEKESLSQLLDAIGTQLSRSQEKAASRLKIIILSRPQPVVLQNKLGQYLQIQLDASNTEISHDVKRYIFAKVDELAREQNLSEDMVGQVQQTLLAGADGTFLWVGFVTNELQGRSWSRIDEVLRQVPKGLGGVYQRLLQQISDKEALVPILRWVVLAARPLTLEELTVAGTINAEGPLTATQVTRKRLARSGLLVKVEGDVVNLVHESAKEFFQGDQVKLEGIEMFHMGQHTHKALMETCIAHVERGFGSPGRVGEMFRHDPFLSYASQYWPIHFHHAIHIMDANSELSRPFFQVDSPIRDEWWKVYWGQEKHGGTPPSFTLLHFAAYFGNVPWAKLLIRKHARLISRKDNYGRTPLSWAANEGHKEMVRLLLDHGARVNFKDRSMLTALHIAVTGQHTAVVAVLLDHGARLEAKGEQGDTDTPLMRAILASSIELTKVLLEHGARVDKYPALFGLASIKGPMDPMDERVKELLGLQELVFHARFKRSQKGVDLVTKGFALSHRFPFFHVVMGFYMKYVALNRWDSLSVLQELVQSNKTEELRQWAKQYIEFFIELTADRNQRNLKATGDLTTQIFGKVAPRDLQALLAIIVFVGMETQLTAVRDGWREGDAITAAAMADWAAIAYNRDVMESFHFGIRESLNDFDVCIRGGDRQDAVYRASQLLTAHFAFLNRKEAGTIAYFSRVVTEFFDGFIGTNYETDLFNDINQACAKELVLISNSRDFDRLRLFLTAIFHFAQQATPKGQDRILSIPSGACLILCHQDASTHQWLINEAIPEGMAASIANEASESLQKRACKTLVECLIIGKQYGLPSTVRTQRQKVVEHLHSLPGVKHMMDRVLTSQGLRGTGDVP